MPVLSKSLRPSKSTAYLVTGVACAGLIILGVKYWKSRQISASTDVHNKGLLIFYSTQKGQSKVCYYLYLLFSVVSFCDLPISQLLNDILSGLTIVSNLF